MFQERVLVHTPSHLRLPARLLRPGSPRHTPACERAAAVRAARVRAEGRVEKAEGRESRIAGRVQRAESREQRAESGGQGVENRG